jgi:hypothetical protein
MSEAIPSGGEMPPIPESLEHTEGDSATVEATKLRLLASVENQQAQGWINKIKAPVEGAKAIEVRTS